MAGEGTGLALVLEAEHPMKRRQLSAQGGNALCQLAHLRPVLNEGKVGLSAKDDYGVAP